MAALSRVDLTFMDLTPQLEATVQVMAVAGPNLTKHVPEPGDKRSRNVEG
jgi:hypothetical protein